MDKFTTNRNLRLTAFAVALLSATISLWGQNRANETVKTPVDLSSNYRSIEEAMLETNRMREEVESAKNTNRTRNESLSFIVSQKNKRNLKKDQIAKNAWEETIAQDQVSVEELIKLRAKFGNRPTYYVNKIEAGQDLMNKIRPSEILSQTFNIVNTQSGNPNGEKWYEVSPKVAERIGLATYVKPNENIINEVVNAEVYRSSVPKEIDEYETVSPNNITVAPFRDTPPPTIGERSSVVQDNTNSSYATRERSIVPSEIRERIATSEYDRQMAMATPRTESVNVVTQAKANSASETDMNLVRESSYRRENTISQPQQGERQTQQQTAAVTPETTTRERIPVSTGAADRASYNYNVQQPASSKTEQTDHSYELKLEPEKAPKKSVRKVKENLKRDR